VVVTVIVVLGRCCHDPSAAQAAKGAGCSGRDDSFVFGGWVIGRIL
jgi:hypothetical protein